MRTSPSPGVNPGVQVHATLGAVLDPALEQAVLSQRDALEPWRILGDALEAVLSQRDALEPWRILGDALEAAGDPRGRLVGLMLANEAKPALKLMSAWKDWLKAHASALVPPGLDEQTLGWRRGFLATATLPGTRLLELVEHPSLRLLEHAVVTGGASLAQLEGLRLPWRKVELLPTDDAMELRPLSSACPYLEQLVLRLPADDRAASLDSCATVTGLAVENATPATLRALTNAFPRLEALTLTRCQRPPDPAQWQELLGRLKRLVVEDRVYDSLAPLLEGWPGRLSVRTSYRDDAVAHGVNDSREDDEESAWLLAPPADVAPALREHAAAESARDVMLRSAEVTLGGKRFGVHRVRASGDELSLGGCAVAIAKRSDGRCLGFASSQQHQTAVAWVVKNGPARSSVDGTDASKLFRRSVELLFGVDPGPLALDEVRRAFYGVPEQAVLGKSSFDLELVTDVDVVARGDEDDEYGEDEDEEYDEAEYWAAQEEAEEELRQTELARAEAPAAMASETDSVVKVVPAVLDVPPPAARTEDAASDDDDEDEEPFRDAVDATVEDIWTQTPVERDEDLEEPVTRAYDEPEPVEGVLFVAEGEAQQECALCHAVKSTAPCTACGEPVCAACGDGDEDDRLCFECE